MIGQRLGPYEIIAPLGAGGMGEVYRARDTKLDREVAIKVLPAELAQDTERLARFGREAKLLASLNHPNIAHVYGFEGATVADGSTVHFLAMELVEGEDLAERLKRGAIPVEESIAIAKQIAEGLEEAHEHGIIHRDLKPANIKVTPDGKVKVLDFGLAKAMEGDPASSAASSQLSHSPTMSRHMTEAGMIMGTAAYMSPEQARGKAIDKRTDIWAFGAVLFEILTGQRLFRGETVSDTLAAVLREDVPWSRLPVLTPRRVAALLRLCLTRDPKMRLRDIGDARVALEVALAGQEEIEEGAVPTPGPRRRRPWAMAAMALTAAVAGVALGRRTVEAPAIWSFTPRTFVTQTIFNARFMPDGESLIFSAALSGATPSLFESRSAALAPRAFGPAGTHLLSISKSGELLVIVDAKFLHQRLFRGTLARMAVDGAPRAIADGVREADWLPDGSEIAVVRDTGTSDHLEFPMGHVVHSASGYLSDPRVSPDGSMVAFLEHPVKYDDRGFVKVADRAGRVTALGGEFTAIEGVSWTVDSLTVRFAAISGSEETQVYSVPARGGTPPRRLVSSAGSLYLHDQGPGGRLVVTREVFSSGVMARGAGQSAERDLTPFGQSWNPLLSADGKTLVAGDGQAGGDYVVTRTDVSGSPPSRLGEGNPYGVSKDDRWVVATRFSTGRCVAYPTGTGPAVEIPLGPLERCQSASWFPDGKSLLILGNEPGKPTRAYRADFPGGMPSLLLREGLTPRKISSDGGRLLVEDGSGAWQVFVIGGDSTAVRGLAAGDRVIEWPDLRTAIAATGEAPSRLYRVDLETGKRTKVAELAPLDRAGLLEVEPSAWREDGRQYAYRYTRQASALYVVSPSR